MIITVVIVTMEHWLEVIYYISKCAVTDGFERSVKAISAHANLSKFIISKNIVYVTGNTVSDKLCVCYHLTVKSELSGCSRSFTATFMFY